MNCTTCKFFVKPNAIITTKDGMCCRYPPVLLALMTQQGPAQNWVFPMVGPKAWCGEYKAKVLSDEVH